MQIDIAIVIAIASFIGVISANALTNIVTSRLATQENREGRYRDRLEFLRQSAAALIAAREKAARASIPQSRVEPVEVESSAAIATARAIILMVADEELNRIAEQIGIYSRFSKTDQPTMEDRLQAIDKAIERLGVLIKQQIDGQHR